MTPIKETPYLPYDLSKLMKTIGYDEVELTAYFQPSIFGLKHLQFYTNNSDLKNGKDGCVAASKWKVKQWFINNHKWHYCIYPLKDKWGCDIRICGESVNHSIYSFVEKFDTYLDAELCCISKMASLKIDEMLNCAFSAKERGQKKYLIMG